MRPNMPIILCSLATLAGVSNAEAKSRKSSDPNVILILIDDTGWNGLSEPMDSGEPYSGSSYFRTPNMDKLVRGGTKFSHAYSSAPTSSPSRHSIQFGQSPSTMNLFAHTALEDVKVNASQSLANRIKESRPHYKTAHFGKWHVVLSPEELGYDLSDGMSSNGEGNRKIENDPKCTFSLSRRANNFISEQVEQGNPFFMQLSYYANHDDIEALASSIEMFNTTYAGDKNSYHNSAEWAAMNYDLDCGVGSILNHLAELGIEENTYIILTADNGYERRDDVRKSVDERGYYQSYPLRAHKYLISEGGIRVPFIMSGPTIKAGGELKCPVVGHDIYPTILDIIGIGKQTPDSIEGLSLLSLAEGESDEIIRRSPLVFRYTMYQYKIYDIAIVEDNYKLLKDINNDKLYLWDLTKDQGEAHNLADQMPAKRDELYVRMTNYFQAIGWDESMAGMVLKRIDKSHYKEGQSKAN